MKHLIKYGSMLLGIALLFSLAFSPELFFASGTSIAALGIFARTCGANKSGTQAIWIAEKSVVTSITVASGEISAIAGTTPFMRVDADQDKINWEQSDEKVGANNVKFSNLVEFAISKLNTAMNTFVNALIDASPCGLYAIVKDGNGQNWLVGYDSTSLTTRPLRYNSGKQKTGKLISEEDGNTKVIQLTNECMGLALPFDSTLNAAINAGTSTIIKWS